MDKLRGNTQYYAHRWQNQQGRSGYTIACENEWHQGACGKSIYPSEPLNYQDLADTVVARGTLAMLSLSETNLKKWTS